MKKFVILFILSGIVSFAFPQDIHFSQFNNSPLTLNPASVGVFNGDIRAILNYKSQWKQVSEPFKTYAFSFDAGLLKKKWQNGWIGLGVSVFNDQAGASKMSLTQGNLSVSSVLGIAEGHTLSVGIQAGMAQRKVDYSGLQWDSQYDGMHYDAGISPGENLATNSFSFQDYSTGLLWSFGKGEMYSTANDAVKANLGLAMFHVNKPVQDFLGTKDKLYSKYVIHGMFFKGIKNTKTSLIPSAAVFMQGKSKEILAGLMVKYNLKEASKYTGTIKSSAVYLGGYYRFGDAIAICAQFEVDRYFVGISYDVNMSGLTTVSKGLGGLEIALRFITPNPAAGNVAKSGHSNTKFL